MIKRIIKLNGTVERYDILKPAGWLQYSAKDLDPDLVDLSGILLEAYQAGQEEMHSQDLQKLLITVALSRGTDTGNRLAGVLYACYSHKNLFPNGIPHLREHIEKLQSVKLMDALPYTPEEYERLNAAIDHNRDMKMRYYSIQHILVKYALSDVKTRKTYETPQFTCMRMALELASKEPVEKRVDEAIAFYEEFSHGRINGPTPNWRNLATFSKGLASCCLYATTDTARSIAVGHTIVETMTYMSAGIGGKNMIRSIGDPVRNGAFAHQGKQPYQVATRALTKANLQGSRGGASTDYIDCFDPEIRTMVMYQNPRTPEDKKIRGMHFNVILNNFFCKKALNGERIFLFNTFTAPDLYKAFSEGKDKLFAELYAKYEQDESFVKNWDSAREILTMVGEQFYEVSTVYCFNIDEANYHTPYKEPIHSSNLCVAPETSLLTNKGHVPIVTLVGQTVDIWNGEEWSTVEVVKTGENQKLITVKLSDGRELDCTEYHKWYIQDGYGIKSREVRTNELEVGQKLIKFDLPIIEGTEKLPFAYHNGFYNGDGTSLKGDRARIYLYGEKMKLAYMFGDDVKWRTSVSGKRIEAEFKGLQNKYFVPQAEYSVKSRLEWLAGYLDADGCVYRNGTNEAFTAASVNLQFLNEMQDMLQTLGVSSKVTLLHKAGIRKLPLNDGSGLLGDFECKETYRLLISSVDSQKLLALGLSTKRLKMEVRTPQRDANQFVTVIDIVDTGRTDDTYCVTEPKRNMAVFNGILTGQCAEITNPTKPYENMIDLFTEGHHNGEVGLCSIGGVVYTRIGEKNDAQYLKTCYYALKMIAYCIHNSYYELPHIGYTAKMRMNASVGLLDIAYHMAKKGLSYNSYFGYIELHKIAERHAYFMIEAALLLSKEIGNAPWIDKTKWPDGWLPIDTYNKNVDSIADFKLRYDWEELRARIIANGGIAFSSLIAHMPTEASSKAAGAMNGLYPARMLSMVKTDGTNAVEWCAPESDTLGHQYQLAWEIPPVDMFKVYAIFQKFCDQSISADIYRDRRENPEIKHSELLDEISAMMHYGVKSRYYTNSLTVDATDEDSEIDAAFGIKRGKVSAVGNTGDACGSGGCTL